MRQKTQNSSIRHRQVLPGLTQRKRGPKDTLLAPLRTENPNDGRASGATEKSRRLHAAGPCELPLLEALLAEDRPALSRSERHRGVLAARRARGLCFHALPGEPVTAPAARAGKAPAGPLGLA